MSEKTRVCLIPDELEIERIPGEPVIKHITITCGIKPFPNPMEENMPSNNHTDKELYEKPPFLTKLKRYKTTRRVGRRNIQTYTLISSNEYIDLTQTS